jgi:hypothetical protein
LKKVTVETASRKFGAFKISRRKGFKIRGNVIQILPFIGVYFLTEVFDREKGLGATIAQKFKNL